MVIFGYLATGFAEEAWFRGVIFRSCVPSAWAVQPGHLVMQLREALDDARRSQQLG